MEFRRVIHIEFQWAPTLGGECYLTGKPPRLSEAQRFNGHPPLGVNATNIFFPQLKAALVVRVSMGTHPWG